MKPVLLLLLIAVCHSFSFSNLMESNDVSPQCIEDLGTGAELLEEMYANMDNISKLIELAEQLVKLV